MARVEIAPEVLDDLDRFLDYFAQQNVADAAARLAGIMKAIDILEFSPLIGRPDANGRRELVIGKKGRGFLALYRYAPEIDTVFVLALRSQREAGYSHE